MLQTLWLAAFLFLQGPTTVTVSGRVIADPVTSKRVMRVAISSVGGSNVLATTVDSDGTFEVPNVPPGSYTVIGFAATTVSKPIALTVGTSDIMNLSISLPEPKEVSGRITVQGNVPANLPVPRLTFSLSAMGNIPNSSANLPSNPQPDGSFKIVFPEGERRITVAAATIPPGYKVAALTYGATDLLKDPARIDAADTAELRVTLDASGLVPVSVSGHVTGLLTTNGVRVVLTHNVFGSSEASVNSDGSFAFSKVLPGSYVARLSLSGISAAKPVTVGDRDVTDVLIAYPREFVVTGHIIVEGGLAGISPDVVLEARDAKTGGGRNLANNVGRGVIMFNLHDGEYTVTARNAPDGYRIKSIMYGTTDLQKELLKIDGPVTWEIIVRLALAQ
jgi:hypothetical protein